METTERRIGIDRAESEGYFLSVGQKDEVGIETGKTEFLHE